MSEIGIYSIEYERMVNGERQSWKACIGAYGIEEAREYLFQVMGNVKITALGHESRLDAISDNLRNKIIANSMPKRKGPGRPKGAKNKTTKEDE